MADEPNPVVYRFLTERLLCRCHEPEDVLLRKAAADASHGHLQPFIPWAAKGPLTLDEHVARVRSLRASFDEDRARFYAMLARDDGRFVGEVGLMRRVGARAVELGYWVNATEVRRGFAVEAISAMLRVAFDVDRVERVDLRIDTRNLASMAVARRLAFHHEGTLRRQYFGDASAPIDLEALSLTREEYAASPAARARVEAYDFLSRKVL